MGRVKQLYNLFGNGQGGWSTGYEVYRNYNLAGAVKSRTYPSGRTVNYAYDLAGRTLSFTGYLGDGTPRTYATGINYGPWGTLTREQFGTNTAIYNKLHYNIRGQLCDVRASSSSDEWSGELGALANYYSANGVQCGSGSDNNGNLRKSQTIVNGSYYMEDRYDYDSLNRLAGVSEYQNGATLTGTQQYDYDRWGNRTIKPVSTIGQNYQFNVNTATNQLRVPTGDTQHEMTYDNAGNLTRDTYTGAGDRSYDGDNHIVAAQDILSGWSYYTYNANGQRVRRKVNNQETWQIYGIDGELVAEYAANGAAGTPQKEYGYRNGQLLITAEPTALQTVSWTNTAGVSVNGNSLTKTAATAWGNAGASSTQSIASGDSYVEVTATETSTSRLLMTSGRRKEKN
jgi:YD repeat-containing protein